MLQGTVAGLEPPEARRDTRTRSHDDRAKIPHPDSASDRSTFDDVADRTARHEVSIPAYTRVHDVRAYARSDSSFIECNPIDRSSLSIELPLADAPKLVPNWLLNITIYTMCV